MTLKADLRHFLDEKGNQVDLTEQAKTIFRFLITIISSASKNIKQPLTHVDLKCNTRAEGLSCKGSIEAAFTEMGLLEWHCDSCEACGTISNWQGSFWDKQIRTIH
jgi:hypothetical protein